MHMVQFTNPEGAANETAYSKSMQKRLAVATSTLTPPSAILPQL